LADRNNFDPFLLLVEQCRFGNGGFAAAGDGLHLAVVGDELPYCFVFALRQHGIVIVHHRLRPSFNGQLASIKQDGTITDRLDGARVMRDQQQGGALLAEFTDAVEALVLEVGIPHRQRFIDNQHIRAVRGSHAEGQPHLHAAGVHPHRLVDVVADLGKGFDLGHEAADVLDTVTEQLPGHEGILPTGKIGVEAHTQFEQGGDPAGDVDVAGGGLGGAGDHLEQRALAGTIDADDADRLTGFDSEVDILQHPGERMAGLAAGQQPFGQPRPASGILFIGLTQIDNGNRAHQSSSTISPAWLRNSRRPSTQKNKARGIISHRVCHWGHWP